MLLGFTDNNRTRFTNFDNVLISFGKLAFGKWALTDNDPNSGNVVEELKSIVFYVHFGKGKMD